MDRKVGVGGVSRITVTSVLSESAEKNLKESFRVSFFFVYRKSL